MLKGLTESKDALQEAVRGSKFIQDYLTHQPQQLQKKYPGDFVSMCGHVCAKLDGPITALARSTSALVQMKLARESALEEA